MLTDNLCQCNTINGRKLSKQKITNLLRTTPDVVVELLKNKIPLSYIWDLRNFIPASVFSIIANPNNRILTDKDRASYIVESEENLNIIRNSIYPYIKKNNNAIYVDSFLCYIKTCTDSEFDTLITSLQYKTSHIIKSLTKKELKYLLDRCNTPLQLSIIVHNRDFAIPVKDILNYVNMPAKLQTMYKYNISVLQRQLQQYLHLFSININDFSIVELYLNICSQYADYLKTHYDDDVFMLSSEDSIAIGNILEYIDFDKHILEVLVKNGLLFESELFLHKDTPHKIWKFLDRKFIECNIEHIIQCIHEGDSTYMLRCFTCNEAKIILNYNDIVNAVVEKIISMLYVELPSLNTEIAHTLCKLLIKKNVFVYIPHCEDLYISYISNHKLTVRFVRNVLNRNLDLMRYISTPKAIDYIKNHIIQSEQTVNPLRSLPDFPDSILKYKDIYVAELLMFTKLNKDQLNEAVSNIRFFMQLYANSLVLNHHMKSIVTMNYLYENKYITKELYDRLNSFDYTNLRNYIDKSQESINKEVIEKNFKINIDNEINNTQSLFNTLDIYED